MRSDRLQTAAIVMPRGLMPDRQVTGHGFGTAPVFLAALPEERAAEETARLEEMIAAGRIPIGPRNLVIFPTDAVTDHVALVQEHSARANLVMLELPTDSLTGSGVEILEGYPKLGDVLFVSSQRVLTID